METAPSKILVYAQVQPLHLSGLVAMVGQSVRGAGHDPW